MALFDRLYQFADAQAMPNNTTAKVGDAINWVEQAGIDVTGPLFVIVTVNTVPSAGTSAQACLYRHTTGAIASGTCLVSGEVVARGNMSANPRATGEKHVLAAFLLPPRSDRDESETDEDVYFGLVLATSGDVSTGKVDAYLTTDPPVRHTVQQNTSNI